MTSFLNPLCSCLHMSCASMLFINKIVCVCVCTMCARSLQLCPTLVHPMVCSQPGSPSMGFFRQDSMFLLFIDWFLGLPCCTRGFLQLRQAGSALWLWCTGFFLTVWLLVLHSTSSRAHGLQQSWSVGSLAVARGLWSVDSLPVVHRLSYPVACGSSRTRTEPVSPALAGEPLEHKRSLTVYILKSQNYSPPSLVNTEHGT